MLPSENSGDRTSQTEYYLPKVEIKDYNVMINNGGNFSDQPIKNYMKTYDNKKTAIGQWDDYRIGCLLDYIDFREIYKFIAKDLSKQQALNANPKVIQQISFTGNPDRAGKTKSKSSVSLFCFNKISI